MTLKRIEKYNLIILPIIWIIVYRFIIMPFYEIGDLRFYVFLGIIIGLSTNFLNYKNKLDKIIASLFSLIIIGFIYDWYFYVNDKIIMSPHSFLNLSISGAYSLKEIISFSTRYFSAITTNVIIAYLITICTTTIINLIDLKKISSLINIKAIFQKSGKTNFINILSAIFILSLIHHLFNIQYSYSLYNSLSESVKANYPKPDSISFQIILFICLFSFVEIYGLFLLTIKTKLRKRHIILIFAILLFIFQYIYDLIVFKSINQFSYKNYFDYSVYNCMIILFLSVFIEKQKIIVSFLITALCVWLLNNIYESFLYNPDNYISSIILGFKRIFVPIIAGLISGITYYSIGKLTKQNTQPNTGS